MAQKKKSKAVGKTTAGLPALEQSAWPWSLIQRVLLIVVVFVLIAYVIDRAVFAALHILYSHSERGPENINRALHRRVDGYIFGDSRARHHFDPAVIQADTGLQFFNAGTPGFDMLFYRCLADLIEKQYTPQWYVVNISLPDLHRNQSQYPSMVIFAPYIGDSTAVRDVLTTQSWRGGIKFAGLGTPVDDELIFNTNRPLTWKYQWHTLIKYGLSDTMRFNARTYPIIDQVIHPVLADDNGFHPLNGPFIEKDDPSKWRLEEDIDLYFAYQVIQFVRQAKAKGIHIAFVVCPSYRVRTNFMLKPDEWYYLKAVRQCARELDVPLLEISEGTRSEYRDQSNYVDTDHLNGRGAEFFSHHFALLFKHLTEIPDWHGTPYQAQIDPSQYVIPMELFTRSR